jgi:rod shape determining protein RodA
VGEEFGMVGAVVLLLLYLFVLGRALYLALQTQNTFARLLSGSIALTFIVYVFINMGMVSGLMPVVGVPLPLFSYGGTSAVTLLTGFGILMSLYSHRKLVA